jgi:hypothetical protein
MSHSCYYLCFVCDCLCLASFFIACFKLSLHHQWDLSYVCSASLSRYVCAEEVICAQFARNIFSHFVRSLKLKSSEQAYRVKKCLQLKVIVPETPFNDAAEAVRNILSIMIGTSPYIIMFITLFLGSSSSEKIPSTTTYEGNSQLVRSFILRNKNSASIRINASQTRKSKRSFQNPRKMWEFLSLVKPILFCDIFFIHVDVVTVGERPWAGLSWVKTIMFK